MDEMNEAIYSPEWTKIGAEVMKEYQDDKFKNIHNLGINVAFLTSKEAPVTKGKAKMGECIAVKKEYHKRFIPHDYLIIIYEPNVQHMTPEQKKILVEHELMHINAYENEEGETKLGINPHEVEDFQEIIDKYGADWAKDVHTQMTWDDYNEEYIETDPQEEKTA